ncbi:tRNA guanosine(34) transglycosylase Tgt [Candidatus Gottesmanbacteria bacterium]|nr:tRNA guanosine(34) transglycosylase Tgt [Candidatus Gottesmanbacteria bacterium]
MASFRVTHTDKKIKARTGIIKTAHGDIHTPAFFPVGTQATVKALSPDEVAATGTEGILVNTYHMYLRPGHAIVEKFGGLHSFMGWDRPIMTDSGGFQVFSLGFGIEHEVGKIVPLYGEDLVAGDVLESSSKNLIVRTKLCKIEEKGPTFVSHIDGSAHFFPPEKSIDVQMALGADLIVALDECTSPLHDYDYTRAAMERTHRWELRCLRHLQTSDVRRRMSDAKSSRFLRYPKSDIRGPALYGVIQGGPFQDLRIASAKFVSDGDFFGVGIGGALVSKKKMAEILDWIHPHLDPTKPRHLFGIGTIDDIFAAVAQGVDTFDCVTPTRLGRMGYVLTNVKYQMSNFKLNITKSIFLTNQNPIDPTCNCYTCQHFSIGYLCHLFRSRELLAYRLATIHNLAFMAKLMKEIQVAIGENRLRELKGEWLGKK